MAGGDAEQLPASLWSNIRDLSPDSSDRHKNKNDDCPSGSAHHMALGLVRLVYVLPINNSILQSPRSSSPSWCSLSALQITENNLFSFERARFEHANSYVERHSMFSGRKYRGDLFLLGVFIGITINATVLYIRMGYG